MAFSFKSKQRVVYSIAAGLVLSAVIFGSSVYGQKSLSTESSKMAVVFPAGNIVKPTTFSSPNGAKIMVKPFISDVDKRGIFKRIFNPGVEKISISGLTNIDTRPHRVGVKLTGTPLTIKQDVKAGIPWDSQTNSFTGAIAPGASVPDISFSWYFYFSGDVMATATWYEGRIIVFDADTGENLTTIPVKYFSGARK